MNTKYRKTIIAGNWKMNMLVSDIKPFIEELKGFLPKTKTCETVLCVPAVNIPAMMNGRRRNVAPPAPAFAMRPMASSRSVGVGTPSSMMRAFSRSSVMMLNFTFQFFCPRNSSMYRSSFVHQVPFVEKQSG